MSNLCKYCGVDCKDRPQLGPGEVWSHNTARKYGWFSRRHQTNKALDAYKARKDQNGGSPRFSVGPHNPPKPRKGPKVRPPRRKIRRAN